jgi:hypothetical protein
VVVVVDHSSVPGGVGSVDVVPSGVILPDSCGPPAGVPVSDLLVSVGDLGTPPSGVGSVLGVSPVDSGPVSGGSSLGGTSASSALAGVDSHGSLGASLGEFSGGGLLNHLVGGSFGGSGGSDNSGKEKGDFEVHLFLIIHL